LLPTVYFISGLGADKRVFSFLDLSFCDPVFIEWVKPIKNESLQGYAIRLKDQIKEANPIIVGVSFGGMLATEIVKADPGIKTILISSSKTKSEIPKIFRIGKYLPVYKLILNSLFKKVVFISKPFLSAEGTEQKKVVQQIINDIDPNFLKWALGSILNWDNKVVPQNLIHIHGTADKLLPCRLVKADYLIKDGKHLMVMDKHSEITALLKKLIT
jgi:pimeloyl-ACP methyl ester carboxylesterase